MDYQTFRGADVQEALYNVREALGTDALIESTRHVTNGQGGPLGRTFVEIVAAPSSVPGARQGNSSHPGRGAPSRNSARPRGTELQQRAQRSKEARPSMSPFESPALEETAVGRELVQLRLMLDELSQGRAPKDR